MTVGLAVHFFMGGMRIDSSGASTVPGLYGAGEVTGGIHGANRLGGNALMEAVVFGRIAGASAARYATPPLRDAGELEEEDPDSGAELDAGQVRSEVQELLWRHAGVERCRNGLERGLSRLAELQEGYARAGKGDHPHLWHETRNTLIAARLIFTAALCRTESRGAHYRSDFPDTDHDQWDGSLEMGKSPGGNDPTVKFVPTVLR
jgi:fumarate reductase (CoM/CoB) subunit A